MDKIKTPKQPKEKEFQLSIGIQEHDIKFKANNARKLMEKGHPVVVRMRLRGRITTQNELIVAVFDKFVAYCGEGVERDGTLVNKGDTWQLRLRRTR